MLRTRPTLAPPASPLERLPEEWEAVLRAWGEPRFRALQVFRWIHRRGVLDPEAMTDLPRSLRARLTAEGPLAPVTEVALFHRSGDGTRKLLVRLGDGREVETVLLPQGAPGDLAVLPEPGDPDDDDAPAPGPFGARAGALDAAAEDAEAAAAAPPVPISQCISTQVGCAMGCVFCASGVAGLKRHLSAGEIVAQVLVGRRHADPGERLRNVVLMGMGEPLHNYDAVARALVLLTHPEGAALSSRRVTLSTSGLVPQIDRLGADFGGQVQLAVSLHAVTDERRSALMPINRKHPLEELMACLRRYPLPRRRRITIEYTLIAGKNDDAGDADRLADLLDGVPSKVNLIPMNPVAGSPLGAPALAAVDAFQARLRARGVATFVRRTRGDDIAAACGQLALHGEKRKVRVAVTAGG
jgi:23S rRNA (adenine2503-C2)-methyltransferase